MSNRIRASQWRDRVQAWKRSGQTAAEFGARQGVDPRQLHWWSWWLRKKPATMGHIKEPARSERVRLLPVRVVPMMTGDRAVTYRGAELTLGSGGVVRIVEGTDPAWAACLVLRVMQESGRC